MVQVFRSMCNGCRQESGSKEIYTHPTGWHRFYFQDEYGAHYPVDICPTCWNKVTFKLIVEGIPQSDGKVGE